MSSSIAEMRNIIENDWAASPYYDQAEGQIVVF